MAAKEERREALSIPEAREGRGSEHGALDCAARSCTSGIDRRSRTEPRVRPETNVERGNQPKAVRVMCSWPACREASHGSIRQAASSHRGAVRSVDEIAPGGMGSQGERRAVRGRRPPGSVEVFSGMDEAWYCSRTHPARTSSTKWATRFRLALNHERPHEALGNETPGSVYEPSARGVSLLCDELRISSIVSDQASKRPWRHQLAQGSVFS